MPERIIFDTDPGVDDTLAILLALRSPELQILGLTTVYGNTDVEFATANALRLVEMESRPDIPVVSGASRPLIIPFRGEGKRFHGSDGCGNTAPPPPKGKALATHAASFIVDTVLAHPNEVTLAAVGPLTNLGMALRLEPRIQSLVKRVVIMGGAVFTHGNASPVAEANIHNDPHAASMVFSAGWDLTMVGLDVTTRTVMNPEYLSALGRPEDASMDFFKKIVPLYQKSHGLGGSIHTHDPSAVLYLLAPELYTCEDVPVFVETEGHCSGMTVPDLRRQWMTSPLTRVCTGVDSAKALGILHDRLSN